MHSINPKSTSYGELERQAVAKNIPIYAHLDLTYQCNLKCIHCYSVNKNQQKELTGTEIENVFDQLAELESFYLSVSGGEAMLRSDFFQITRYARKKNFALRIFTNGTLISEEQAQKIADLNPLFIEISLYGMSEKVHDSITQTPGSFHRTIKSIHLMKKLNLNVHIKTIVMKQNVHQLIAIQQFADSIGVLFRPDTIINPQIDNNKLPLEYRISDDDLLQYFEEFHPNWKRNELALNQTLCNAGKGLIVISAFGDVYPCLRIQTKAGNIRDQSLASIWRKSLVLQNIRELTLTKLNRCAICDDIEYCSPCPGLALMEHGSLCEPARECCRHAKIRRSVIAKTPFASS